jgi:uncharacterized protein YceK
MNYRIILSLAVIAVLGGCGGTVLRPSATEADFGNSKASLIEAQAANPAASANPSTEPVTGVDPDYATNVIDAMRESVSKPEEVQEPIVIRVGEQSGGG